MRCARVAKGTKRVRGWEGGRTGDGVGWTEGAITAIQAAVVISTLRGPRMAARCVLILLINHYNMQYNSEVYLLFRRADALYCGVGLCV